MCVLNYGVYVRHTLYSVSFYLSIFSDIVITLNLTSSSCQSKIDQCDQVALVKLYKCTSVSNLVLHHLNMNRIKSAQ